MTASTHKTSWSGQYQRPIEHSSTSGRNARCLQLVAGAVVRPARQIEHFGGTRSSLFSSMQSFRIPKKCSPWATEVRAIRGSPSVGRPSPESSERLTTNAQVGVPRMARIHPMPVGIRAPRPAGSSTYIHGLNACCRGEAQPRTGSTSTSVVRRQPSPTLSLWRMTSGARTSCARG